jgi:hypothetical protein
VKYNQIPGYINQTVVASEKQPGNLTRNIKVTQIGLFQSRFNLENFNGI